MLLVRWLRRLLLLLQATVYASISWRLNPGFANIITGPHAARSMQRLAATAASATTSEVVSSGVEVHTSSDSLNHWIAAKYIQLAPPLLRCSRRNCHRFAPRPLPGCFRV